MWRRQSVLLAMPPFREVEKRGPVADGTEPEDSDLLRALKARRMAVAKERGVPAFVIASNAVLERIARLGAEASREAWLSLEGVGENNVGPLREAFSSVLTAHVGPHRPDRGLVTA
jgi:superfamily II DNA helicase RecQ